MPASLLPLSIPFRFDLKGLRLTAAIHFMESGAMKLPTSSVQFRIILVVSVALFGGCQAANHTQQGAGLGAAAGALAGAIIGHQSGQTEEGALIGTAAGALGGGLLGNAKDAAEQRDAAFAYAQHQEMARRAEQRALNNHDIVNMTRNGVSESIILESIHHRGGRFDTDAAAIIEMKKYGVTDPVVQAMMRTGVSN